MRTILILLATVALALPVGAEHCTTYTTSDTEVDTGVAEGVPRYYVNNGPCHMCIFSIWVYEESNAINGLQRGDEIIDDTCHGMIRSDTIIF